MAEKSRRREKLDTLGSQPVPEESIQAPQFARKQKWLHDKKDLLYGSITYRAKFIGLTEVSKQGGDDVVKDAVEKLKASTHGKRLPEVDIAISVSFIVITEVKSKTHVCKSKLQKITYCSESKIVGDKVFAYIVAWKPTEKKFHCFCFETQSPSRKISLTFGQAFHLAYERFVEAKKAQEDFISLRKKLKTPKEKEDFAKKLTELHQAPSMEELADLAGASTASSLKHKRIEERHQLWKELDSKSRHEETSGSRDTKMQKTPSTTMVEGWKRVTTALDHFDEGKSVQKLSSAEDVDSAIDKMESQFESLEDLSNIEAALEAFDDLKLETNTNSIQKSSSSSESTAL